MLYDERWELDEASRILLGAADLIEQYGWCQRWEDEEGRICALHALHLAGGSGEALGPAIQLMEERLGQQDIDFWNDAPGRTAEQVTDMLRAVARATPHT